MSEKLKKIFTKSIIFTFMNYTLKIFLNPIILIFIPIFLSEEMQGYWYTFGSIAALTTFADLGFTTIMTQFAAHEYAFLGFDVESKKFTGKKENLDKIASLFQFVVKWVSVVMVIAFIIIMGVGCYTFSKESKLFWAFPWILYAVSVIIDFIIQTALSFFEGCNQFEHTQKIRTVSSLGYAVSTIGLLYFGGGLYTLSFALIVKSGISIFGTVYKFNNALKQLLCPAECNVNWGKKFTKLLGKYAVSWASGYFAFQLFNPLTFSIYGAKAAGKVGYTLSIIQAIYSLANVWMIVAIPQLNMAVERKEWKKLDQKFLINLGLSLGTYAIGSVLWYIVINVPIINFVIMDRILPVYVMIILSICYLFQMIIYGLAVYLRAHEEEPYMWLSVFSGVFSGVTTFMVLKFVSVNSVFMGLLFSYVVTMPWAILVFKKKRKEWHIK